MEICDLYEERKMMEIPSSLYLLSYYYYYFLYTYKDSFRFFVFYLQNSKDGEKAQIRFWLPRILALVTNFDSLPHSNLLSLNPLLLNKLKYQISVLGYPAHILQFINK